jgi:lipopolysaccharide/colanic/teichoic acid biosynthesis glycosyltransferase
MMHATIREELAPGRSAAARRVPQRVPMEWALVLIGIDALAALAGCYMAGLASTAGPVAAVAICGAMAAVGAYRVSYAVRWYDEAYVVAVACVLAFIPLWVLLHFVTGLPGAEPLLAVVLAGVPMAALHSVLHLARHGTQSEPQASAAYVTPEAQWRTRHGAVAVVKRLLDVALALLGLIVASPIMLLAAVCIAIESGFPIVFRQERVGLGGAEFVMYKFRTMWPDSATDWAVRGDKRVTNVGAILRASSIDELPQLVNVLFGDMSLVGPRPEMPQFAREFRRRIPHYDDRHIVRPGLTGWAQVYCNRHLQPADMPVVVPYDLFYVEHASPALDAVIIVKTVTEFLARRGV